MRVASRVCRVAARDFETVLLAGPDGLFTSGWPSFGALQSGIYLVPDHLKLDCGIGVLGLPQVLRRSH